MPDLQHAAGTIYQCLLNGEAIDYVKADLWPDTIEKAYEVQVRLEKLHNNHLLVGKSWPQL